MNVEDLIIKSFQKLGTIECENGKLVHLQSNHPQSNSRLIFPQYWTRGNPGSERVSEQEARFLFVKELEDGAGSHQYYYSVETPTKKAYQFSKNGVPILPVISDEGQSANIDVCLYNKMNGGTFERRHLIEFKFGNPDKHDFSKDFLKLLCDDDDGLVNYFVHIVKYGNLSQRTLNSVQSKYQHAINNASVNGNNNGNVSTVEIFLYNIGENRYFRTKAVLPNAVLPNAVDPNAVAPLNLLGHPF
jgi:hypothetical protein